MLTENKRDIVNRKDALRGEAIYQLGEQFGRIRWTAKDIAQLALQGATDELFRIRCTHAPGSPITAWAIKTALTVIVDPSDMDYLLYELESLIENLIEVENRETDDSSFGNCDSDASSLQSDDSTLECADPL